MRRFFAHGFVWGSAAALVAGAALFSFFGYVTEETFVVSKSDVVEESEAEGDVVAAHDIVLQFPFSARVAAVHAQEGEKAAHGDALLTLDASDLEVELEEVESRIEVSKATLSQLLAGVSEAEIAFLESKAEEAHVALVNAQAVLEDKKLETARELDRRYARAGEYAHTVLLNAEGALKGIEGIYDERNKFRDSFLVPESPKRSEAEWQMLFARTALENVRLEAEGMAATSTPQSIGVGLAHFKTNLEVMRALLQKTAEILETASAAFGAPDIGGFRTTVAVQRAVINETQTALLELEQDIASQRVEGQLAVNDAERSVAQLEAARETAESELALKKAVPGESHVALVQAQAKEQESRARAIRESLRRATLVAPSAGAVARVWKGEGERGSEGSPAVTLSPLSAVQIEVEKNELSQWAEAGDAAFLYDSDGAAVSATVGSISEDKAILYLRDGEGREVPSRVSVRVRTLIREGALMVPRAFLFEEAGATKAYVRQGGRKSAVSVLSGIEWGGAVEILEGLSEGDRIIRP